MESDINASNSSVSESNKTKSDDFNIMSVKSEDKKGSKDERKEAPKEEKKEVKDEPKKEGQPLQFEVKSPATNVPG